MTVGNSAACSGRSGSLTLSVRLLGRTSPTKPWHVDRARARTFTDLRHNRYLVLEERCRASTVRAVFGWILRDSGGAVVSSYSVKTATLKVPGPDCRFVFS